jgi:tripeptide aminopeptidase
MEGKFHNTDDGNIHSTAASRRFVDTFLDLVRIDGVAGQERGVASYLERRLSALGVEWHMDRAGETFGGDCGNLVARLAGTVDAPAILLGAHMDTVGPTRGLTVIEADGRLSSDGTTILGADDRAGIAIILGVLSTLVEERRPHGPIEVAFTVSEERGMHGAKALDIGALSARMGFLFDSSAPPGQFVVEAPGAIAFRIVVRGLAAHAAVAPEKGVHAIQVASRAIASLPLGRLDDTGMLNVGSVHGGGAINVVPDTVEITGETRSPDPTALERQIGVVRDAFERCAAEAGGAVEISLTHKYGGFHLGSDDPVVRAAASGIAAAGFAPTLLGYPGGSDANVLNDRGLPCVNLGIGTRDAHSPHESIAAQNLLDGVRIGLSIVHEAARGGGAER